MLGGLDGAGRHGGGQAGREEADLERPHGREQREEGKTIIRRAIEC